MKECCLIAGLALGMSACSVAVEVDVPLDLDGDGILGPQEVIAGTDPLKSDSDGDGFDDGMELGSRTDPLSAAEHPYVRGWPMDFCRNEIESTGNGLGEITEDFELVDQDGGVVRLYDFCDHTVVLVSAAFWCTSCPDMRQWWRSGD